MKTPPSPTRHKIYHWRNELTQEMARLVQRQHLRDSYKAAQDTTRYEATCQAVQHTADKIARLNANLALVPLGK